MLRFRSLALVASFVGCSLVTSLSDLEGGAQDVFNDVVNDAGASDAPSEADAASDAGAVDVACTNAAIVATNAHARSFPMAHRESSPSVSYPLTTSSSSGSTSIPASAARYRR